jgi:hypothetical protein
MTLARSAFAPRKKNSKRADEDRRFPSHLGWLRKRPCLIEGRGGHVCSGDMEAHHVNEGNGGMGLKTFDYEAVPVCSAAHIEVHCGKRTFEDRYRLNLEQCARDYAKASPHRHQWEQGNG